MNPIRPKQASQRLDKTAYEELRQKILKRDGWRCQLCGAMQNLQVHHQVFRSQSGGDTEDNLMTLCDSCHAALHNRL